MLESLKKKKERDNEIQKTKQNFQPTDTSYQ